MDPQTYCARTCSELIGDRARRGTGHEAMQRAAVLAYFAGRELSSADFARELKELRRAAVRDGRLPLADAARGVLLDWEGRGEHIA